MAGYDPNQPRDKEGQWTEAGNAARKAAGLSEVDFHSQNLQLIEKARENKALEQALNQSRNYGIGRPTTLKNYLPVFNPEIKKIYIESHTAKKVKYEYYVWKGNRGLEIPKIVYDNIDLPEEIIDNR